VRLPLDNNNNNNMPNGMYNGNIYMYSEHFVYCQQYTVKKVTYHTEPPH